MCLYIQTLRVCCPYQDQKLIENARIGILVFALAFQ